MQLQAAWPLEMSHPTCIVWNQAHLCIIPARFCTNTRPALPLCAVLAKPTRDSLSLQWHARSSVASLMVRQYAIALSVPIFAPIFDADSNHSQVAFHTAPTPLSFCWRWQVLASWAPAIICPSREAAAISMISRPTMDAASIRTASYATAPMRCASRFDARLNTAATGSRCASRPAVHPHCPPPQIPRILTRTSTSTSVRRVGAVSLHAAGRARHHRSLRPGRLPLPAIAPRILPSTLISHRTRFERASRRPIGAVYLSWHTRMAQTEF